MSALLKPQMRLMSLTWCTRQNVSLPGRMLIIHYRLAIRALLLLLILVPCPPDSDRIAEYDMKLMDIDSDTLGIPDTDYDARVTLPSNEFTRIVRDLSQLGESVRIEVSKEGVRFASEGEAANGSVLLRQTEGATTSGSGSSSKKGKTKKIKAEGGDGESEGEEGEGEGEDGDEGTRTKKINVKKEKVVDGDVEMNGDDEEGDEDEFKPKSDDEGEEEQDNDNDDDQDGEEGSGKKRKKKVCSLIQFL
jgi:proliferating cell nuclear antigen